MLDILTSVLRSLRSLRSLGYSDLLVRIPSLPVLGHLGLSDIFSPGSSESRIDKRYLLFMRNNEDKIEPGYPLTVIDEYIRQRSFLKSVKRSTLRLEFLCIHGM